MPWYQQKVASVIFATPPTSSYKEVSVLGSVWVVTVRYISMFFVIKCSYLFDHDVNLWQPTFGSVVCIWSLWLYCWNISIVCIHKFHIDTSMSVGIRVWVIHTVIEYARLQQYTYSKDVQDISRFSPNFFMENATEVQVFVLVWPS